MRSIPTAVLLFSLLGLLPLLMGTLVSIFNLSLSEQIMEITIRMSITYAGLILSFLGGCLFAFKVKSDTNCSWQTLISSFLPTLWAFSALSLPSFKASALAIGFLITYELDRKALQNKLTPNWWLALRLPLTTVVIVLLIILGFYA